MTPEIVPMCEIHLDAVEALECACFSVPWSRAALESELREPQNLWLAAVLPDGEVAGYIGAHVLLDEASIMNLAVAPGYRRCGIGSALLRALLSRLESAEYVFLEVRAGNEAAQALYRAHGFKVVGRRPGYYVRPAEDALLMRLDRSKDGGGLLNRPPL